MPPLIPMPTPGRRAHIFDEQLQQARPRLLRIALAFGISPDGAEDVAQETSLRAWRHLVDLRETDHFDAWLDSICRNQCRMHLRALRRAPEVLRITLSAAHDAMGDGEYLDDKLADTQATDPLAAVSAADAALLIERAFAYLSPQEHALLEQRYLSGLPTSAAADALGITTHVLEARLSRARAHLRAALAGPLRSDAEDFGLNVPSDGGWRTTRIGCYLCGRRKLLGRFETAANGRTELRLRCPSCSLHAATDVFRSKGIATLDGLRAFMPALTRSWRAIADRTQRTLARGYDVCLHCGSAAPRRVATADEFPGEITQAQRRHWVVAPCSRLDCPGLGTWAALDALIGADPLTRRFIADHPHWVTAPEEAIEWQGRSVIRFHLSDVSSAARMTLLADRHTLQTLATF